MKTFIQTAIFILFAFPVFGQTKADFLDCLNLIFDQYEFQPAFSSHETTQGQLIISSPEYQRARKPSISDIRNSIRQEDFYDFDHDIKVVMLDDFERLGIQREADLKIFLTGSESEMSILLNTIIWNESQRYSWSYYLVKTDDEWEIKSSHLSKEMVKLPVW